MTTNTTVSAAQNPYIVDEQLRCALTGVPVRADEAYWAPPLVTARELIGTVGQTLFRNPAMLGSVLMDEQSNVPYAPAARAELANRRSTEQVKLLLVLLVLVAVIAAPILWIALH